MDVLWLRPSKPDNISVGRERVAAVLEANGVDVTVLDASGLEALSATCEGLTSDYDAIVGTVRMGLYVGVVISSVTRLPILADITDPIEQVSYLPSPLYRIVHSLENFSLRQADARVFLYESSYERAASNGLSGTKLDNGVDYDKFADPDPEIRAEAKERLGDAINPTKKTAVYVGGLEPVYNIRTILAAAEKFSDWNFLFVGDGSLADEVSEAASRLSNVYYPGSVRYELVPGVLSYADAGLCLVDAEQPLKVLEYGAAGLPTLALSGELEMRFPDDALYYIEPEPREVVEALESLGSSSDTTYGETLREIARDHSWEQIGNRYLELLHQIRQ